MHAFIYSRGMTGAALSRTIRTTVNINKTQTCKSSFIKAKAPSMIHVVQVPVQHFTAVARESAVETDLVKSAVKELLSRRDTELAASKDIDLAKSYQHFQNLLQEARSCINDCVETKDQEEVKHASDAVEDTFAAYLDLLDDFRGTSNERLTTQFGSLREKGASDLKELRKELDSILDDP